MESNQLNSPIVFSHKGQGKYTHFQAQMQRVITALYWQDETLFLAIVEPSITVKL